MNVHAGANLRSVMASHPAGTTYCLAAGTFSVTSPIATQRKDRVIGAGRDATFIDGSGLDPTAEAIFVVQRSSYFARFDISGAPTPTIKSRLFCSPRSNCGRAFKYGTRRLIVRSVDCHGNGNNCIGGGGSTSLRIRDLNCWANGNAYSMTPEFRSAACIKVFIGGEVPGRAGTMTIRNSRIHDNRWVGLWCDFCTAGRFDVEDNHIVHNGSNGLQWEMSGGWSATDSAIVEGNVFHRNNYRNVPGAGGMAISTANDITVSGNTFGGNVIFGLRVLFDASRDPPQPDSRGVVISHNRMRGDDLRGCRLAGVTCRGNG